MLLSFSGVKIRREMRSRQTEVGGDKMSRCRREEMRRMREFRRSKRERRVE